MTRHAIYYLLIGFLLADLIGHVWFAISGLLPLVFFPGIVLDYRLNTAIIFTELVVLPFLVVFAWTSRHTHFFSHRHQQKYF